MTDVIIVPVITGLITFLIFKVFYILAPHQTNKNVDEEKLEKNKRKYALYKSIWILPYMILVGVITLSIFTIGSSYQSLILPNVQNVAFAQPNLVVWFVVPVILAIGLAILVMNFLYKVLLRDEYLIYVEWNHREHGLKEVNILYSISKFFIIAGLLSIGLLLNVSLKATQDTISVTFFLQTKEYPINEHIQLVHYTNHLSPSGEALIEEEKYALLIDEKEIWATDKFLFAGNIKLYTDFLDFLQAKSKLILIEKGRYNDPQL